MTLAEIREAVVLTAISASNLISGVQDEREREELEAVFRDTFAKEREAARLNKQSAKADTCPECKGNGGYQDIRHAQICGQFEDEETRAHFHAANCRDEWVTCRVCRGRGTLDPIQLAVYTARGGAPPVQIRGFA